MDEQERTSLEERELEEAEEVFAKSGTAEESYHSDGTGDAATDEEESVLAAEIQKIREEQGRAAQPVAVEKKPSQKKEETAKENQQILAALGFKRYEDTGVIKYSIRVMDKKIGVTFNETNPLGKVWAYTVPEGEEDKEFLKNGELAEHPLIEKYIAIKEGKEPMPEIRVTGKITEKRGKAIKIEIEENGETKQIFFGQGAVKKDNDGYFIPAGFSKATKDHEAKMAIPRNIRLQDYLIQLEQAPMADTTEEKKELPKKPDELAKAELQPTGKTTMDEIIKPEEEYTDMGEQVIIEEHIKKYVGILARVTEVILAEDRIPDREKGYGVKFVYYSVIGETKKKPELSKHEIEEIARAILDIPIEPIAKENGGDNEGWD